MKYLGPELHPSGIHSAHHSRANSRQHHRHHHRHHHHHHGKRRTHEENQSVSFVTERPKSRQVKLEDHHNELMIDDLFDDKQFCKRSQHQVSLFFRRNFLIGTPKITDCMTPMNSYAFLSPLPIIC